MSLNRFFTEDTYSKFDEATNSFVDSPLLFEAQEMLGEVSPTVQTVYGAAHGNVRKPIDVRMGRVETCDICNHEYRLNELVEFRGKFYCLENLHNKVIGDILLTENLNSFQPPAEEVVGNTELIIDQSVK